MVARLPPGREPNEGAGGIAGADLPGRVYDVAEGEHQYNLNFLANAVNVDACGDQEHFDTGLVANGNRGVERRSPIVQVGLIDADLPR